MAQGGAVALLLGLRFKKGVVGSLIWAYFVCPEMFSSKSLNFGRRTIEAESAQESSEVATGERGGTGS